VGYEEKGVSDFRDIHSLGGLFHEVMILRHFRRRYYDSMMITTIYEKYIFSYIEHKRGTGRKYRQYTYRDTR
jgi:hypothetical protein